MRQALLDLRTEMEKEQMDLYLVMTDDFHASEYTGSYFKTRAFLTGFTGSAGMALVSRDWAGLWTDGRYFLQAAEQLKDTGFTLMRQEEPGVPRLEDWIRDHLTAGMVLGFDGRTVSAAQYARLEKMARRAGASLRTDTDLIDRIWKDRPALSHEPAFELDTAYAGKTRAEKIAQVREALEKEECDTLVLSTLMDICWLLNLRGNDVACTPVVLSYLILTPAQVRLFVNPTVLSDAIVRHLQADGVTICPYESMESALAQLPGDARVLLNPALLNAALRRAIPENVAVREGKNPTELFKAIKNPVEVANFRKAHIKDGVAVTRFMYWLKTQVGKVPMDEISVAEKLESLRAEQEHYMGPSFEPIMAYGDHGAIVHYSATEATNRAIQPRSFLLSDTGGHYLEGTTDITRTYAMGPLTDEEKCMYTRVLQGHLHLGDAHFRYGMNGMQLDYLAHEPLWRMHMDYNHGTGHGVGYLLSVHEGPQGFFWKKRAAGDPAVLEPGMIISDEPGVYLEGRFGVRLEDLVVVCEDETNAYGRFMHLEYLTMVPWDRDAIDVRLMSEYDRALLDAYHRTVYETIAPYLPAEEAAWLKQATRPIAE